MDLDQDEVFGASSRDDLSGPSFRFRHAEEDVRPNPAVGSIHRGRPACHYYYCLSPDDSATSGTVRSVKEFGAFVRLASVDRDGM